MRTYFRIVKALVYLAILLPPTILFHKFRIPGYKRLPHAVHGSLCRALNIRVREFGRPVTGAAPVLYVSNHVSWVDILVLGHIIKGACFIARDDMAEWPILGYLATLQRTIFIKRGQRSDVNNQKQELRARMRNGDNLILFPEGTTSDGSRVLPFKSALFGVTEQVLGATGRRTTAAEAEAPGPAAMPPSETESLMVQPVTIIYRRVNNMPVLRSTLPKVAWYGDMELAPHLKGFLRLLCVDVEVHFHEPVSRHLFKSRKELAGYCHRTVEKCLVETLRGRKGGVKAGDGPGLP